MRYRSKPTTIEAQQFFADRPLPFRERGPYVGFRDGKFYVTTAHAQTVDLEDGDWVILEPSGASVPPYAAYPCKPDIFKARYVEECMHDRLNEDGICRRCGADCRGANYR